jgi:hypothetical protein
VPERPANIEIRATDIATGKPQAPGIISFRPIGDGIQRVPTGSADFRTPEGLAAKRKSRYMCQTSALRTHWVPRIAYPSRGF